MWPFKRRKQGRRLEAARAKAETHAQRMRHLRQSGLFTGLLLGTLLVAGAVFVLLIGGRETPHQLGERLDQPYIARVGFQMADPDNPNLTLQFAPGDVVARFGVIDERDLALIIREHDAFIQAGGRGSLALHILGLTVVALLTTAGLGIYVAYYEPRILRNWARGLALVLLLLVALLASRLVMLAAWQNWLHVFAAATAALLAVMVLCIAYSQRFALGAGWFLALLIVLAVRRDFQFLLVLIAGVSATALSLNNVRSRSKLVGIGLISAALMAIAAVGVGLIGGHWNEWIGWRALAAAAAGLAAGLIMQGLLPLIERAFGIATAMTLLEYSDVSKPLLRRLAAEAPGTFNHSLLLGTMAEAAAEAIGANGLLARVGAYYHDLGKINKPAYFVENQEGTFSRHAKLSPAMSLLIILGHVKDGLELAKEYNIPRVIWPFITEHHGTTLVEYFYHAATRKSPAEEPPAESQFRYPGPKPQSKETAILMLCDSVEGATRSLAEPTPGRIEDVVHQIARKKLDDGQLDECNLTLRELHIVEQSLIKSLWGFYHGRIAYPSSAGKGETKPDAKAGA